MLDFGNAAVIGEGGRVPPLKSAPKSQKRICMKAFRPYCNSPEEIEYKDKGYSFDSDVWMLSCWFTTFANPDRSNCFSNIPDEILSEPSQPNNNNISEL